MIFIYLILFAFPVWIIFKFATNYDILIGCRYVLKYSFYGVCIFGCITSIYSSFDADLSELDTAGIIKYYGQALGIIALLPLFWNFWKRLYLSDLYTASHIKNLDYFVLYLRSFADDSKNRTQERAIMGTMYEFFCPFAVGKPDDLKSYAGSAPRIYLKDDWKERVLEMMKKAPIILLRVNNTNNFFWEFEQCVLNNYLDKSLLWVSDIKAYEAFQLKVLEDHNIALPTVDEVYDNCMIYRIRGVAKVCKLEDNSSYQEFWDNYNKVRGLNITYSTYFAERNENFIKTLFRWNRNPEMPQSVQQWSWSAFLFPEYYILFQRFPHRSLTVIFLIIFFWLWFIVRIPFMILLGRNGKKIVWLAEKWESMQYFEKIHFTNSVKALAYGTMVLLSLILVIIMFQ